MFKRVDLGSNYSSSLIWELEKFWIDAGHFEPRSYALEYRLEVLLTSDLPYCSSDIRTAEILYRSEFCFSDMVLMASALPSIPSGDISRQERFSVPNRTGESLYEHQADLRRLIF